MKKTITAALVLALGAPLAMEAQEVEVTANAGFVSEYIFRGIPQKTSSASAGLDLGIDGLYLGTWAADVGQGAEVDLYAGYGIEYEGFALSAGGTGYFYTGAFDDTYLEANLGAGYGPLSLEYSFGQHEQDKFGGPLVHYSFLALTAEQGGLYATYGAFGSDMGLADLFDVGQYGEAGYGFSAMDMDFAIAGVLSDDILSLEVDEDGEPTSDLTFVFGVSKTFSLTE